MHLLNKHTGKQERAVITKISKEDWIFMKNSDQFNFDWRKESSYLIWVIKLKNSETPLGLISIQDFHKEKRLHIRLIESSNSNKGKGKEYDYVAGCLIAAVCKLAFEKNYDGFVSLKPKSELVDLYISKYFFSPMGQLLFIDTLAANNLIEKYSI